MWDIFKHNICIVRVPKGKERNGAETKFEEIMTENFSNLRKILIYISKKLNEFQAGKMQRDPYTDKLQ